MENEYYQKAINLITSREKFHICLGLDRVKSVLDLLGNPQNNLKIIHVAGTNDNRFLIRTGLDYYFSSKFSHDLYRNFHGIHYKLVRIVFWENSFIYHSPIIYYR